MFKRRIVKAVVKGQLGTIEKKRRSSHQMNDSLNEKYFRSEIKTKSLF